MQPLQICIGFSIRIGRESWCLPYPGFSYILSYIVCMENCQNCISADNFFLIKDKHKDTEKDKEKNKE